MKELICNLEKMLKKKLEYYCELLSVMEKERNFIIDLDIESLWDACAIKKEITLNIEKIRKEIVYLIKQIPFYSDIDITKLTLLKIIKLLPVSKKIKSNLDTLVLDINIKKDELQQAASENSLYIEEYLTVIDGVMLTIIGVHDEHNYSAAGTVNAMERSNYLINDEV